MTREEHSRLLLEFVGLTLSCNEEGWNFVYRIGERTISTTDAIDLFADTPDAAYWREAVQTKLVIAGDLLFDFLYKRESGQWSVMFRRRHLLSPPTDQACYSEAYAEAFCEAAAAAVMALKESETTK